MPYPPALVKPMRAELTDLGIEELTTAEEVDSAFNEAKDKTMLLVINSVCGCAAANARPAVALALQEDVQPDKNVTVFAGQHLEATDRAREHLKGIPPSSPFLALFKEGSPVHVIERKNIEGRSAQAIASELVEAFNTFCSEEGGPVERATNGETSSDEGESDGELPDSFRSIMN